jgi:hypothetical protein
VKVAGATKRVDCALVGRARQVARLKGYVTNLPATGMDGPALIADYHDLWRMEQSFRMTKVRPTRPTRVQPRPRRHRSAPDL